MKIKGLYISDWIAVIVSAFLPRNVKYYAMLDWVDWLPGDDIAYNIDCPRYTAQIKKVLK